MSRVDLWPERCPGSLSHRGLLEGSSASGCCLVLWQWACVGAHGKLMAMHAHWNCIMAALQIACLPSKQLTQVRGR